MPFTETMTPRERTLAALNRQPVDRPPVANPTNVATVELMDLVDAPFPDACRDEPSSPPPGSQPPATPS